MDDSAPVGDHGIDGRVTERLEMLAETLPGVPLPAVKRQRPSPLPTAVGESVERRAVGDPGHRGAGPAHGFSEYAEALFSGGGIESGEDDHRRRCAVVRHVNLLREGVRSTPLPAIDRYRRGVPPPSKRSGRPGATVTKRGGGGCRSGKL